MLTKRTALIVIGLGCEGPTAAQDTQPQLAEEHNA
jgi:hypothetical protein